MLFAYFDLIHFLPDPTRHLPSVQELELVKEGGKELAEEEGKELVEEEDKELVEEEDKEDR